MRLLRAIHQWVGLTLCAVLFALGLSGAILVWEDEIMRTGNAPAQQAAPTRTPAERAADIAAIERAVAPESVQWIRLPRPRIGVYEAGLGHERVAVIDPRTLELIEIREGKARAVDWLFELHIGLFADEAGERVQGFIALMGIGLALSGAVLWWPARRGFSVRAIAPESAKRPQLLASHRHLGIVAAAPIVLTLVLAVALSWPQTVRHLMAGGAAPVSDLTRVRGEPGWRGALEILADHHPDAEIKVIAYPRGPGEPATFRMRQPGEWQPNGRTYAEVDLTLGERVSFTDAQALTLGERAFYAAFPIHAAKVGGLPWKLVQTFAGLALAGLSLLGALAFLRKPRPT